MHTITHDTDITMRCRPFTGAAFAPHRVRVCVDGSVLVWDDVAQHFTRCHVLTQRMQARARQLAADQQ